MCLWFNFSHFKSGAYGDFHRYSYNSVIWFLKNSDLRKYHVQVPTYVKFGVYLRTVQDVKIWIFFFMTTSLQITLIILLFVSFRHCVCVSIPLQDEMFNKLPIELQRGGKVSVTPVLFNIGINEQASLADK